MNDDGHAPTGGGAEEAADALVVADEYGSAVRELDAILQELEGDDVDVDTLASRVRRAGALLTFCRRRIDAARLEVEQIVAGIDDAVVSRTDADGEFDDEPQWDVEEGTLFGDGA
jgi:exodeoxyribonuclease VII small subunit